MFEAVRALNLPKGPSNIGVHDEHGCLIATDTGKAAVVAVYLEHQLTRDKPPLELFVGPPRTLARRFTSEEFGAAARSLKNGRANGPDGIPNELSQALYWISICTQTFCRHHQQKFRDKFLS